MDSELYFPDYLSALSRTLLRFFGQPLSKQLYIGLWGSVLKNELDKHFCKFAYFFVQNKFHPRALGTQKVNISERL